MATPRTMVLRAIVRHPLRRLATQATVPRLPRHQAPLQPTALPRPRVLPSPTLLLSHRTTLLPIRATLKPLSLATRRSIARAQQVLRQLLPPLPIPPQPLHLSRLLSRATVQLPSPTLPLRATLPLSPTHLLLHQATLLLPPPATRLSVHRSPPPPFQLPMSLEQEA